MAVDVEMHPMSAAPINKTRVRHLCVRRQCTRNWSFACVVQSQWCGLISSKPSADLCWCAPVRGVKSLLVRCTIRTDQTLRLTCQHTVATTGLDNLRCPRNSCLIGQAIAQWFSIHGDSPRSTSHPTLVAIASILLAPVCQRKRNQQINSPATVSSTLASTAGIPRSSGANAMLQVRIRDGARCW